jgi:hypothetical protein
MGLQHHRSKFFWLFSYNNMQVNIYIFTLPYNFLRYVSSGKYWWVYGIIWLNRFIALKDKYWWWDYVHGVKLGKYFWIHNIPRLDGFTAAKYKYCMIEVYIDEIRISCLYNMLMYSVVN